MSNIHVALHYDSMDNIKGK